MPLLARLYVRKIDLAGIVKAHRPKFQTKLELAVALVRWALAWLNRAGKPLWIVVDGAYAMRPFLKPVLALGVTVVSRLRRDAALFALPEPRPKNQRGRPRKKGRQRIDLAKRAGVRLETIERIECGKLRTNPAAVDKIDAVLTKFGQ